jgi:DNA gyrase/topoisomerase IV subunit B
MPIQLEISPRLIPNIANLYNDTNRIFMEYIDNSIDSAEDYFDGNSYSRKIEITLRIGRNEVTIEDNST